MKRSLRFEVSATSFDREAAEAVSAASRAYESARNDLIRKFMASERFRAACDLAGVRSGTTPNVTVEGGLLIVTLHVNERTEALDAPHQPPLSLDPKLANILLHGKILSNAEKRDLITKLAPGVLREVQK